MAWRTGRFFSPLTIAPVRLPCGTSSSSGSKRPYFVRSKSAADLYFDLEVLIRQRQPGIFSQVKKPAHVSGPCSSVGIPIGSLRFDIDTITRDRLKGGGLALDVRERALAFRAPE